MSGTDTKQSSDASGEVSAIETLGQKTAAVVKEAHEALTAMTEERNEYRDKVAAYEADQKKASELGVAAIQKLASMPVPGHPDEQMIRPGEVSQWVAAIQDPAQTKVALAHALDQLVKEAFDVSANESGNKTASDLGSVSDGPKDSSGRPDGYKLPPTARC